MSQMEACKAIGNMWGTLIYLLYTWDMVPEFIYIRERDEMLSVLLSSLGKVFDQSKSCSDHP